MKGKEDEGRKIRDIMVKDVAYVTVPGTREELMELYKKRSISGVPVVKEGKIVGIVTRQDLLRNPDEDQIALLMTRNPIKTSPEAAIEEAARVILSYGIRRLPVVEGEKLVGIVTVADFLKEIAQWENKEHIGDYIRDKTFALWEEMPLSVAARIMELAMVMAAPVLNSELELTGLITDRDLINAAVIEELIGSSDLSLGSDEDEWTWDGMRNIMTLYYTVSKIRLPDKLVKDVMVKELVTARRNSGVSECARKMSKGRFDQLPVISARGQLIGMLIDRELLRVFL